MTKTTLKVVILTLYLARMPHDFWVCLHHCNCENEADAPFWNPRNQWHVLCFTCHQAYQNTDFLIRNNGFFS